MVTKFERRGHWRTNINGTRFFVRPHEVEKEFYSITSPDGYLLVNGKSRLLPTNCRHCGSNVFYASLSPTKNIYLNSDREPLIKHQCLKPSANKIQHNEPLKRPKQFLSESEIRAQEERKEIELEKKVSITLGGSWKIQNFPELDLEGISKILNVITSCRHKIETLTLRKNSLENLIKRQTQKQKKTKTADLKDSPQEIDLFRTIDELSLEKKEVDKNIKALKKALGENLIRKSQNQKTFSNVTENITKGENKKSVVKAFTRKEATIFNKNIRKLQKKISNEADPQIQIQLKIQKLNLYKSAYLDQQSKKVSEIKEQIKKLEAQRQSLVARAKNKQKQNTIDSKVPIIIKKVRHEKI